MKRSIYLFLIMGILFSLQSCNKEETPDIPDNLTAPSIPSAELFTIPTQSFGNLTTKGESSTRNDKSNWVHAGLNVLVWNSVVFVNTAIPVAAFGRSFDFQSEYIGDLTWQWRYPYQAPAANGGTKYEVTLTGQYIENNQKVEWIMTVNEVGNSNKFIWYEGVVNVDHTEGIFTVNKDPLAPKPYMTLGFTKDADKENVAIRFSNVLANDPGFGDYIEWRAITGSSFDRAYDVFTNDDLLEIEANSIDESGRVKHPSHFNDSEWHCWDEEQFNIDC